MPEERASARAALRPGGPKGYAIAVATVAAATACALPLWPVSDTVPAMLFLAAVVLTAWSGGLWPGLLATGLGALLVDYFFESPVHSFVVSSPTTFVDLAAFLVVAVVVSLVSQDLRAARARAERARAAAEVLQRRFSFLADASAELAAGLEYEAVLAKIARLAVPTLAEVCIVDVLDEDGSVRRVAVATAERELAHWAGELEGTFAPDPGWDHGVPAVLRSGQTALQTRMDDQPLEVLFPLVAATGQAAHLAALSRMRPSSRIIMPMKSRERVLGAITFLAVGDDRRYDHGDVALAEDLARRCAAAIDNARLYRDTLRAVETRDQLLAGVTHDLRAPLTAIRGRLQLLRRRIARSDQPPPDGLDDDLARIEASGQGMAAMVQELLDSAHLQSGRPLDLRRAPVDLVLVVRQAVADYEQSARDHAIRFEAPPAELVGCWDAGRIERVVTNLLSNAVKYSPGGSTVTVAVDRDEAPDGAWAVLTVADEGIGIPESDLPRVFERFFRASNAVGRVPGTGLGLAGVRAITEQHGGHVELRSCTKQGSTVTVRLPLAPAGD